MTEQQQPYLGQRCHVEGKGFGTIIKLHLDRDTNEPPSGPITEVRVELDAGGSRWYALSLVELLPTYPAV